MPRDEAPSVPISSQPDAEVDAKLLAKIGEGISEVFGDGDVDPDERERGRRIVPREDSADPDPDPEPDDELDPEPDPDPDPESDSDPDPEDDAGSGEEYDIPEAYLRSGAEYQFSKDDIVDMINSNGKEATEQFLRNMHAKANQQSAWFADAGRRMKELERQASGSQPTGQPPAPSQPVGLSEDQLRAYEAEYGPDNPLLAMYRQQQQMIGNLNDQLNTVNGRLSKHDADMQQLEADRKANDAKKVVDFFNQDAVKPYGALYGQLKEGEMSFESLPLQHRINRDKVLELAGNIMLGAEFKGQAVTLDEALNMAHNIVSEPMAAVVARESIIKSVEKRHKTRVVRPSDSKRTGNAAKSTGKPKSDAELLERTNRRLAKVFGG